MKRKAFVRVMAQLGGYALLAMAALIVMMTVFSLSVLENPLAAVGIVLAVLLLAAMGLAVLSVAKTFKLRQKGVFVMQKGENGTIGVSLHAIEKQVYACIGKHDLIQKSEVSIEEGRDGLIIQLYVDQVSGVNIPLSVGLLQRQVRQYVTSCSGVDVQEVRVMVENGTEHTVESPYAVQDVVMAEAQRELAEKPAAPAAPVASAAPTVEEEPEAEPEEIVVPASQVVLPPLPAMPEYEEEDDRPLHQRLFGAEEEPVFVPAPPVMMAEAVPQETEIPLDVALEADAAEDEQSAETEAAEEDVEADEEDVLSTLY